MMSSLRQKLFVCVCFGWLSVSAQVDFSINDTGGIYIKRSIVPLLKSTQLEGDFTPWLFTTNVDGEVLFLTKELRGGQVNYNIETRQLQLNKEGRDLFFDLEGIVSFKAAEMSNEIRTFEIMKSSVFSANPTVVEAIHLGKYSLFLDRFVEFKRGDFNPSLNVGEKDRYITTTDIFLRENPSGELVKLNKKSDILKSIDSTKDLKGYWSDNKLDFDVSSLVRLILYAQEVE